VCLCFEPCLLSLLRRGLLQSRLDCTFGRKRAEAGKREKFKSAGNAGKGRARKEAPAFPLSLPIAPRTLVFSLQRSRSRIFLSLVFTNRTPLRRREMFAGKEIVGEAEFCGYHARQTQVVNVMSYILFDISRGFGITCSGRIKSCISVLLCALNRHGSCARARQQLI